MTRAPVTIGGERYILLEDVAESYRVEIHWLEEAYALGLLGRGEKIESSHAIPLSRLGVVSRVVRCRVQAGVYLMGIAALVDPEE